MTSPPSNFSDEISHPALAHIVGARVDAASFVAQTGLVVLSLYKQRRVLLAAGIGPISTHIGLLPQSPIARTNPDHPLVAALKAHLVGTFVREVTIEDDAIWITTETHSDDLPALARPLRLVVKPGRQGKVRLLVPNGPQFEWPSPTNSIPDLANPAPNLIIATNLEEQGAQLVQISNLFCLDSLRRELLATVRKRVQRLERRIAAVRQDLGRLDDVPRFQKIGSLLLSQGQTITRGTTRAELIDWETNEPIVVNLAPDKPAQSQAAEFFQKARRLQRGSEVMQKRLAETLQQIESIKPWELMVLDAPADWDVLQEIAQKLEAANIGQSIAAFPSAPKKAEKDERKSYHTFHSANGREIWVGKSGKDNDELVTRLARPHDLWLHAKNIPGAHVIVPLDKHHSCPPDVLVDAATLAAHFSNARHESRCEVSYVERRYVRKPKKSAPGSVTTHHEKVIDVRIEKDRLGRLLGSKLETR